VKYRLLDTAPRHIGVRKLIRRPHTVIQQLRLGIDFLLTHLGLTPPLGEVWLFGSYSKSYKVWIDLIGQRILLVSSVILLLLHNYYNSIDAACFILFSRVR